MRTKDHISNFVNIDAADIVVNILAALSFR